MTKTIRSGCDLDDYSQCFYLEKEKLYTDSCGKLDRFCPRSCAQTSASPMNAYNGR